MTDRANAAALLVAELLLVDVHHVLDGDLAAAELVAQLAEALEGEVGGEDGPGDLLLALFDALGQGDLALAGEEGDAAHLAQVEPHRVFGPPHGAGGEVDGVQRAVVVVLHRGGSLDDLGGHATGLGGVDNLDVHGSEHHHDVVELIQRHDVRREGVVDLVVGQEAFLLPDRDQPIQLF